MSLPKFVRRLIQALLRFLLSESENWKKDKSNLKK